MRRLGGGRSRAGVRTGRTAITPPSTICATATAPGARPEAGVSQPLVQPVGQGTGFEADRGDPVRQLAHERNQRFRCAGDPRLRHDLALLAENADCRACQRYIQPDIDIHVVALSFRGIGARLSARPREHAARVRATTPESPSSLQAPTVPDSTEPHYGISGRIGEEPHGPDLGATSLQSVNLTMPLDKIIHFRRHFGEADQRTVPADSAQWPGRPGASLRHPGGAGRRSRSKEQGYGAMKMERDFDVQCSSRSEYSPSNERWCLRQIQEGGAQVGRDLVPCSSSLYFEASNVVHTISYKDDHDFYEDDHEDVTTAKLEIQD